MVVFSLEFNKLERFSVAAEIDSLVCLRLRFKLQYWFGVKFLKVLEAPQKRAVTLYDDS